MGGCRDYIDHGWFKIKNCVLSTRSVKDGSPRLLFDYVLKEVDMKVEKSQYHAMMRVQSSLKFLELARCKNNFVDRNS